MNINNLNKKDARQIKNDLFNNLDKTIQILLEYQKKGENVYIEFNGHKLYSADITQDKAYKEITGMSKQEDSEFRRREREASSQEEKKNIIKAWNQKRISGFKENAIEISEKDSYSINTLDDAISYLEEAKKKGDNIYIDFNGHRLYSADITQDKAYLEVCGMTKEDDDEFRKREGEATTQEEKKDIINEWNEKSSKKNITIDELKDYTKDVMEKEEYREKLDVFLQEASKELDNKNKSI